MAAAARKPLTAAARKPLTAAARRAIAIRGSIRRRAETQAASPANDNAPRARSMAKGLLAACVDAGGFDQNARFA